VQPAVFLLQQLALLQQEKRRNVSHSDRSPIYLEILIAAAPIQLEFRRGRKGGGGEEENSSNSFGETGKSAHPLLAKRKER